jgi:hypothetical protein
LDNYLSGEIFESDFSWKEEFSSWWVSCTSSLIVSILLASILLWEVLFLSFGELGLFVVLELLIDYLLLFVEPFFYWLSLIAEKNKFNGAALLFKSCFDFDSFDSCEEGFELD